MADNFDEMSNAQLNDCAVQHVSWPSTSTSFFVPADSVQHAALLTSAYLASAKAAGVSVNYHQETIERQQPGWVSSHPVPQVTMWHVKIIVGHVIAGGTIAEAIDISEARARTIAVLRAAGNG